MIVTNNRRQNNCYSTKRVVFLKHILQYTTYKYIAMDEYFRIYQMIPIKSDILDTVLNNLTKVESNYIGK